MIYLEYPEQKPGVKFKEGKEFIFCLLRKKWLLITPEEWVRQNFILYLFHEKKYPAALISVEKKIMVGVMEKRYDLVVYNRDMQPYMIIECKEMNVPLSNKTIMQILQYNQNLQANFLVITNGSFCAGYSISAEGFKEINEIPEFKN